MDLQNFLEKSQSVAFWLGFAGLAKLTCQTFFGVTIDDEQINAYANFFAVLFSIVGVFASHKKKDKK